MLTSNDDPDDAATLAQHAKALAAAAEVAIPGWVERSVREVLVIQRRPPGTVPEDAIAQAARAAQADGGPRLRALLATDVDAQRENPLAVLRSLVRYPTAVLRAAGVVPVARDEFARRNFPDDLYDLTPASFADVDSGLHELGLVWGAAKAHIHLSRRRREGQR
jgi:hypothetical protein